LNVPPGSVVVFIFLLLSYSTVLTVSYYVDPPQWRVWRLAFGV
jgi:hypothetical protein